VLVLGRGGEAALGAGSQSGGTLSSKRTHSPHGRERSPALGEYP